MQSGAHLTEGGEGGHIALQVERWHLLLFIKPHSQLLKACTGAPTKAATGERKTRLKCSR